MLAPSGVVGLAQDAAYVRDRYHTPQELNATLSALDGVNPSRTALHKIAVTDGGEGSTVWIENGGYLPYLVSRLPF